MSNPLQDNLSDISTKKMEILNFVYIFGRYVGCSLFFYFFFLNDFSIREI